MYIFVNRGHVDGGIKMNGFQAGSDKGDGGKAVESLAPSDVGAKRKIVA